MTDLRDEYAEQAFSRVSPEAMRWGVWTWAVLGSVGVLVIFAWVFSATASISIPLFIAVVLGFLFTPWVSWLERRRVPRSLGAAIVLVGLVVFFVGLIVLAVNSASGNLEGAGETVTEGIEAFEEWLAGVEVADETVRAVSDGIRGAVPTIASGAASTVSSSISGAAEGIVMIGVSLYICFLMLSDRGTIDKWIGSHIGVPPPVGEEIIRDTADAVRSYFKGLTFLALISGATTAVVMLVIGLPLAITIGVLTFAFSYIPYIGAFISGAFAVLVAFGAGGVELALWVLLAVIVIQTVVESFLQAPLVGSALKMNPLVVFVTTILGGTVAGILGAMFAAPILAAVLSINRTLADAAEHETIEEGRVDERGPAEMTV